MIPLGLLVGCSEAYSVGYNRGKPAGEVRKRMRESACEPIENLSNQESLHQENTCLRAIIADLLIKNQKLRWVVQDYPPMIAGS